LRPTNWSSVFLMSAIIGALAGYVVTLLFHPSLLPPILRLGSIRQPATILFLGTDVVYNDVGRRKRADRNAFNGRSDTMIVLRLDPYRDTASALSIPRDTQAYISGFGTQKINAANVLGGPRLAMSTVSQLLQLPIDHFLVLNVNGLVKLVDEIGGVTVDVPKRMHYMDWTAKLKIDLEPGLHTLTGNQSMGFVRFRHDGLGDIGRVQRQELFIRAVLDKAMQPESWVHIPRLIEIARAYIYTDMDVGELIQMATFVRAVPKRNQTLAMLPGTFSGTGDWVADPNEVRRIVGRMTGASFVNASRDNVHLAVINASTSSDLGSKLYRWLRAKGYGSVVVKYPQERMKPLRISRIIAQRGNPEDANLVHDDLQDLGEIVNASIGDIQSTVTILAGDDLVSLVASRPVSVRQARARRRFHSRS